MRIYPACHDAAELRFAVVVSRFNHPICTRLLEASIAELRSCGAREDDVHVAWVPGAFEIPMVARSLARSGRYDALIALGAVICGETPHFDIVCRAVTDGVREVIRDTGVPVAFGVLTTSNADQALARSGGAKGNKGAEAARVAIEMVRLCRALEKPPEAGP